MQYLTGNFRPFRKFRPFVPRGVHNDIAVQPRTCTPIVLSLSCDDIHHGYCVVTGISSHSVISPVSWISPTSRISMGAEPAAPLLSQRFSGPSCYLEWIRVRSSHRDSIRHCQRIDNYRRQRTRHHAFTRDEAG